MSDDPEETLVEFGDGKYAARLDAETDVILGFLRYGESWPAADDWRFSGAIGCLVRELRDANADLLRPVPPPPETAAALKRLAVTVEGVAGDRRYVLLEEARADARRARRDPDVVAVLGPPEEEKWL